MILLDTNVLIEILKGNQATQDTLATMQSPFYISVITAMELIYGARNKAEVARLKGFIQLFSVLYLSEAISRRASRLVTEYAKSHTLDIPDSLIAATALENRARLFTYNRKDFQFIPDLQLV